MNYAIGLVAHVDRQDMAEALAAQVEPTCISIDDGHIGPGTNHRRVWADLSTYDTTWSVVLEEDALPVSDFRDQLRLVLDAAPAPIVSLYLGRLRPPTWQPKITDAIRQTYGTGAHWIIGSECLHAVGVAVHTALVDDMLSGLMPYLPIDQAIGRWARSRGHEIAYCWPSLVDHADTGTLIRHSDNVPRVPGRVAWSTGTRHRWTSRSVKL